MIVNCAVNLICILCVAVLNWRVNCYLIDCTDCVIESQVNFNCSNLDLNQCEEHNLFDGTQAGKYGYELTPLSEEGSFFFIDNQDQVNLERSDIRDGQPGVNLHLIVRLINSLTCEPLVGVYVYIWQANGHGVYSGVDNDRGRKVKRSINGQYFIHGGRGWDGGGPDFGPGGGGGDGGGGRRPWGGENFDNREGFFRDYGQEDNHDHWGSGRGQDGGGGGYFDQPDPMKGGGGGGGGGGPNDQRYPVDRGSNDQMSKPVDQRQQPPPPPSTPPAPAPTPPPPTPPTPVDQKGSGKPKVDPKLDPIKLINQTTPTINLKLNDTIGIVDSNNQTHLNLNQTLTYNNNTNTTNQLVDNSTVTIKLIGENTLTTSSSVIKPDENNVTIGLDGSPTTESTDSAESTESTESVTLDYSYNSTTTTTTIPEPTDPPLPNDHNHNHQPTDHDSYFKKFHRQKPINDDRFLRGYQLTNRQGDTSFITIIPGWYQNRSQHIHIEVYLDPPTFPAKVTYVGQLYLPIDDQSFLNRLQSTDPYNRIPMKIIQHQDDLVFNQQPKANQLILSLEPFGNGYQSIVTIGIDPTVTIKPFLD